MKLWLLLTTLLLTTLTIWADTKEFVRDYTYIAGEADSKISARQMAMQEVKRELLNEIGTHIHSTIDMSESSQGEKNTKQEIRAMTAGFVKVDVLEEKWDGYKFYIKAKMAADPEEILKRIKDLALNDEENIKLKEQLTQSTKAFEDLRLEMLALKNALDESKSDNEKQKLAIEYAQKSKDISANEIFEIGQDYYWGKKGKSKDHHKAFSWFQKAAELGNKYALNDLGVLYDMGHGVRQDYKLAVFWYQEAANRGVPDAQYNLGIMYDEGRGIQQDSKKAIYWYQKAAVQGHSDAQFNLGNTYQDTQENLLAISWYQKAADQGHTGGMYNLGFMYDEGLGVQLDHKQAAYWYQKAANLGLPDAQYNLGVMHSRGIGVPQSNKLAVYWSRESANQGLADAQYNLALMLRNGTGIQQNHKQSIHWYKKAADQGHAEAQFWLGAMYHKGLGVQQSSKQAVYWYLKAAAQGQEHAIGILNYLKGL